MEAKSERSVASNGVEATCSRKASLEKEPNRRAAETMSKQQLDGTKKARCRVENEQIWERCIQRGNKEGKFWLPLFLSRLVERGDDSGMGRCTNTAGLPERGKEGRG
jgi:hypothetical protein